MHLTYLLDLQRRKKRKFLDTICSNLTKLISGQRKDLTQFVFF
jgi:hypothetical protein